MLRNKSSPRGLRRVGAAALLILLLALVVSLRPADPTAAAFPGVNGKIAFTSYRSGNGDIYTMNADGSDVVRLTSSSALEQGVAWSADGRTIAFSYPYGPIYLMNADGTNIRQVPNTSAGEWASWSPDGTRLAFMRWGDVCVINTDGSNLQCLSSDREEEMYPAWSPDGTRIAYHRKVDGYNDEIYVMNADGSGQTRLTYHTAADYFANWSPDGTKLAFTSSRDGNGEIYVMNADGSGQTRLTFNSYYEQYPAWSPDGTRLVWHCYPKGDGEICAMNADGSGLTVLTKTPAQDFAPDWQPLTGQLTVLVQTQPSGSSQPFTMGVSPGFTFDRQWNVHNGVDWYRGANVNDMVFDTTGVLHVVDTSVGNKCVYMFTESGALLGSWGSEGTGDGQFMGPLGIDIDASGNFYVADQVRNLIQKFDNSHTFILAWGGSGSGDGQFSSPTDVAVGPFGDIYVVELIGNRVQRFSLDGEFIGKWGSYGSGNGQFIHPHDVAVDEQGFVYVTDRDNRRVQKFTREGDYIGQWPSGFRPTFTASMFIDETGRLYLTGDTSTSSTGAKIRVFDLSGNLLAEFGASGSGAGQFNRAYGIGVGPNGDVYVADVSGSQPGRIEVFRPSFAPFILTDGSAGQTLSMTPGSYVISEGLLHKWQMTDVSCTGGSVTRRADTAVVQIAHNSHVVCTITNVYVNVAPVAVDDVAATNEDEAVSIPVMDNDSDADLDALTVALDTPPLHGAAAVQSDGSLLYTPAPNWNGVDVFSYLVADADGASDTADVTVTVNPVNDAPVAAADSAETTTADFITIAVLANDSDIDGDSLSVVAVTNGANGTVVINPDDTVTYTRNAGFNGSDSFTYTVSDGKGGTAVGAVSVLITPDLNLPPDVDIGQDVVIAPDASVGSGVAIGDAAAIESGVTLQSDATIGAGTTVEEGALIGAGAMVGDDSTVGAGTEVKAGVTVGDDAAIGDDVVINQNVSTGDGLTLGDGSMLMQNVVLGDNVVLGTGVKLGKGVVVGDNVAIGDYTQVKDYTTIGYGTQIGATCLIKRYVQIGQDVTIGAGVTVNDYAVIPDGTVVP